MEVMSAMASTNSRSGRQLPLPARCAEEVDEDSVRLFTELAESHWHGLHRLIVKTIGYCDDAEDLTQQAFAEALRSYPHFRGDSEVSTWLYGIGMNLVRNYLSRSSHRRFQFANEEELNDVPGELANPEECAAQAQILRAVIGAMEELPDHKRELVLLMAMDELSYDDAAKLLNVPVGTVRSRLSRARSTLKSTLCNRGVVIDFSA